MLSYPEVIEQAPAVLTKLDKPLNGWIYDIMGQPAWKAKTEPVTFDFIIEKWATNTNAPKRGKQDKTQRPTALLLGSVTMIGEGDVRGMRGLPRLAGQGSQRSRDVGYFGEAAHEAFEGVVRRRV